jgi:hypothetical protein
MVARSAAERAGGKPVLWLRDRRTAARVLPPRLRDGDLLVTIGAGDVNLLAEELLPAGSSASRSAPTGSAEAR